MFDVVGLGLNAMDTICVVDALPSPHAKVGIREMRVEPGGQVATAVATCTRFGLRGRYIGSVGDDLWGRRQLESLREESMDIEQVRIVEGATTQVAIIMLETGVGERTILWHRDPRLNFPAEILQRDVILGGRILHLDGCDASAALQAARWAKAASIPVVIDIDEIYDESTHELLRNVDYLVAAEDFARAVTGSLSATDSVRALASRYGCRCAGITLGAQGAVFYSEGRMFSSGGFTVNVTDTTGAGDVFHGAFIYGLLQAWPLEQTASFANAAAALKCTQIGARRGIPSLAQVHSLLSEQPRKS